jgi:UDP-N-acetylmuramoyl-tripeptide--D-alanyl-D-alanine ligase
MRVLVALTAPFALYQFIRLRRALHVFQLEGYKRRRFLDWCTAHPKRALFLTADTTKKPLVMTGRAWRILVTATVLSVAAVLVSAPLGLVTWAVAMGIVFGGVPYILVAADVVLTPVQSVINKHYLRAARAKLDEVGPLVVGVTGSFGKTSTKFAIAGLIGPPTDTFATPGSYNTPLGVCRAINEGLEPHHQFLIVEMGAYREGEIAELCRFVKPTIGVLTAIGPAHLERFGSLEAIKGAKYEIVAALPTDGTAVMNVDDPEVRALADTTAHVAVIRYGLDPEGRPDVTAIDPEMAAASTRFTVVARGESVPASTRLVGRHAIGHVLAGVAVALAAGRRLSELETAISELGPVEHRLQVIEGAGGVIVIDDAYNSNPHGAAVALDLLKSIPGERKVVVTPGMIELGELQYEANLRFGESAARVADTIIVVARVNRDALVAGAKKGDGTATVVTVDSLAEASETLSSLLRPGDVVLFENDLPDQYED